MWKTVDILIHSWAFFTHSRLL